MRLLELMRRRCGLGWGRSRPGGARRCSCVDERMTGRVLLKIHMHPQFVVSLEFFFASKMRQVQIWSQRRPDCVVGARPGVVSIRRETTAWKAAALRALTM